MRGRIGIQTYFKWVRWFKPCVTPLRMRRKNYVIYSGAVPQICKRQLQINSKQYYHTRH